MSCGLPHEVPCSEILDRVYSYLDNELPEEGIAQVREHLDECARNLRHRRTYRLCGSSALRKRSRGSCTSAAGQSRPRPISGTRC